MNPDVEWWQWDITFRDGSVHVGKWWWLLGFGPTGEDQYTQETLGLDGL